MQPGREGLKGVWAILVSMVRIIACAKGRVQGVGYRCFVDDYAGGTGMTLFVRNIPDGSVTIVAESSDDTFETFIRMIHAPGKTRIRVDTPGVIRCNPIGAFSGSRIRA